MAGMTSARRWRGRGRRGVLECNPSGTGPGADFLLADHLIGPKEDHAETNERGGLLANHPKLDFGHTFAHEELELKKILVTSSGVMEAEAVVGRVSGLCAPSTKEKRQRDRRESDALARHEQSLAVRKETERRI
jgi:hypothetical protein